MIKLERISKIYVSGRSTVQALRDVDLEIQAGDFPAVMGPSGSGKSTLLHLLGGLDVPSSGRILWRDRDLAGLSRAELARWRSRHVGFIFQTFHLMPTLTALENVELPLLLQGVPPKERRARAQQVLSRVGLAERSHHKPNELSGGEQQRVAVARALIAQPEVLLADEPTGNLDSETGRAVLELLREINEQGGVTVVLATHDPEVASFAHEILRLRDGRLMETP
jgi:putative ABC transport system ATP-binding protein